MQSRLSLVLILVLSISSITPAFAQQDFIALTNQDILTMVRAKLSPALIIEKFNSTSCNFDTFPTVLAELSHKGVPEEVLMAMVQAPHGARARASLEIRDTQQKAAGSQNVGGVIPPKRKETPYNARFFVAPMDEGFDGLVSALLIEKETANFNRSRRKSC